MAFQNSAWIWKIAGVRGSHYVALHFLANQADKAGNIPRLKIATLARYCNISRHRAHCILTNLEKMGFLDRIERYDHRRLQISNCYQLKFTTLYPQNDPGRERGLAIWSSIHEQCREKYGHLAKPLEAIAGAYLDGNVLYLETRQAGAVSRQWKQFVQWFRQFQSTMTVHHYELMPVGGSTC